MIVLRGASWKFRESPYRRQTTSLAAPEPYAPKRLYTLSASDQSAEKEKWNHAPIQFPKPLENRKRIRLRYSQQP